MQEQIKIKILCLSLCGPAQVWEREATTIEPTSPIGGSDELP